MEENRGLLTMVGEILDAVSDLEGGLNALAAIHNAMNEGPDTPESCLSGMFFVSLHMYDLVKIVGDRAKEMRKALR